jgi:hypothetical protein
MVTLLITSILLLGLFAIAIYFWQKPANRIETNELPRPEHARGLFGDSQLNQIAPAPAENQNQHRLSLIALADEGNKDALRQAHDLNNLEVYNEVLNKFVARSSSTAQVISLASHVTQQSLPVNKALAVAVIESWRENADRNSTAKMLHTAALSNDAETYRKAVEGALEFWRQGKLRDVPAAELQALFNSEFWVLSTSTRSSGAGFLVKRTLAAARRELEERDNN